MWEADEAWRKKLRSVRLSDLVKTVTEDVPPGLLESSGAWILARS
jgi:hypothetical protein